MDRERTGPQSQRSRRAREGHRFESLRSTRKSARAAVGSVFRELFEALMGQRGLQHRPCLDEPAPTSGFTESIAGDPYTEELIGPTSGI